MCLLLIAVGRVPRRPWLLLGNRDEFHGRPASVAAPWNERSDVAGGRDLEAGGSWLAVQASGRFAAVTNVRLGATSRAPRSRGDLVRDFVFGPMTASSYVDGLRQRIGDYAPFNLVVGDGETIWCLESPTVRMQPLTAGLHVVSNGPLDAPWPKMQRLRGEVERAFATDAAGDDELLALLADETQPDDATLPDTGMGLDIERRLAPVFVRGERYGTRASTLAYQRDDGSVVLRERTFASGGIRVGDDACVELTMPR
jgi:uncharacterized protein with NRDE domain